MILLEVQDMFKQVVEEKVLVVNHLVLKVVLEKLLVVLAVVVHLMVALVLVDQQTLDLEELCLLELLGQVSMVQMVE